MKLSSRHARSDFELVRRVASSYWPARVERITGISEQQLQHAARLLGRVKTAMILTARGPEQQSHGVDNVLAFINLALALGKAGKPYCGYGCLTGQGNGQGGREHGQKADQLPGYRRMDNPADRAYIAKVWGIPEARFACARTVRLRNARLYGLRRAAFARCWFLGRTSVSAPHARHIEERLGALDFLMVSDFFLSETAERADVVLPSAQWAEEEGTMTNLEGRVILRQAGCGSARRACAPIWRCWRLSRIDWDTVDSSLPNRRRCLKNCAAHRLEARPIMPASATNASRARTACSGLSHEDHPGTPRMFLDRFATADGRARFHPVEFRPPAEEPDHEYPLYLTTGRVMAQYQSGTQTRRVPALMQASPQRLRADSSVHGEHLRDRRRRAGAPDHAARHRTVTAQLTPAIRMDTLFVPFHYAGGGRANLLTNPALDPISRMPEFKVCAVRVEKGTPC